MREDDDVNGDGEIKRKEVFEMEDDDEDDEEVLWCSGCSGGRKKCCRCPRRNSSLEKNETCETETESGLAGNSSSDGDNCCPCPCPFPRSQSLAFENIPMAPVGGATSGTCTERLKTLQRQKPLPGLSRPRRHPLIPSKTIVVPPTSSSSLENLVVLENKANSVACLNDARIICREKILASVPNKLSSTGVRILYLCDTIPGDNETAGIF